MAEFYSSSVENLLIAEGNPPKKLSYGTAGFRDRAEYISAVIARVGLFACLRSKWAKSKCIGVMITASHNPEHDNGVKIADVDGGMLEHHWEHYIEEIANCMNIQDTLQLLQNVIKNENISMSETAHIVVGRDTRPSSFNLFECVCRGIEAYGGIVHDLGTVTTPQLHFVVRDLNFGPTGYPNASNSLQNYYTTMCSGYIALKATGVTQTVDHIIVDAANGIGSRSLSTLAHQMSILYPNNITFDIRNCVGDGPVNEECGAEVVQKEQRPPVNITPETDINKMICSFDGDADRIVFHSYSDFNGSQASTPVWRLADGDKIACIIALLLKEELEVCGMLRTEKDIPSDENKISMGVVQTAYANGSSTYYLRSNGIPVVFAKTGVKYLHKKSIEEFDAGIYFEANGHGTVLFSEKFNSIVASWGVNSDMVIGVSARVALARIKISVSYDRYLLLSPHQC
jgi:phosphoacetylglucosamine mutase